MIQTNLSYEKENPRSPIHTVRDSSGFVLPLSSRLFPHVHLRRPRHPPERNTSLRGRMSNNRIQIHQLRCLQRGNILRTLDWKWLRQKPMVTSIWLSAKGISARLNKQSTESIQGEKPARTTDNSPEPALGARKTGFLRWKDSLELTRTSQGIPRCVDGVPRS